MPGWTPVAHLSPAAANRPGPARRLNPFFQLRDPTPQRRQFLRLGFNRLPQLTVLLLQQRRRIMRRFPGAILYVVSAAKAGPIIADTLRVPELLQHLAHPPERLPRLPAPGQRAAAPPQDPVGGNPAPAIDQVVQQVR